MRQRTSPLRQVALVVAGASLLIGLLIGFWPVSTTVVGDVSYSCGSGFIHSGSAWKADARLMTGPQQIVGLSTATPTKACPSSVYRHRDFAYSLVGLAVVLYLVLLASATFDPGATPMVSGRKRRRASAPILRVIVPGAP